MKIFFLSHRKLSLIILTCFFTFVISVLYYSAVRLFSDNEPSIFTMSNTVRTLRIFTLDTNGNGKRDSVIIKIDDEKKDYCIEIKNDDNTKYLLSPDNNSKSIGPYVPWWPLHISIADINNDGIPEIITQFSRAATHGVTSYIFRWNGKKYVCILYGSWEGLSMFSMDGSTIPELVVEEKNTGVGSSYSAYIWSEGSYKKTFMKFDASNRGYDKILQVLALLNTPPSRPLSRELLSRYFTDDWIKNSRNIDILNNFSNEITSIQIQDYIGEEIKKNGNSQLSARWKFRCLVFKKSGAGTKAENYTLEFDTVQLKNNDFMIKKIAFKGQ